MNGDVTHLTRQIMPTRELRPFLDQKNRYLSKFGRKVCVDETSAYKGDMVPVDRWVNSKGELVVLASFDTANSTKACTLQIKRRQQEIEDRKVGPILWSNTEYIGPMAIFGALCLTSIVIHIIICLKNRPRSGPRPRRNDMDMWCLWINCLMRPKICVNINNWCFFLAPKKTQLQVLEYSLILARQTEFVLTKFTRR